MEKAALQKMVHKMKDDEPRQGLFIYKITRTGQSKLGLSVLYMHGYHFYFYLRMCQALLCLFLKIF